MGFPPLSESEEEVASAIVDAAYAVHKNLGPGLLEKVYDRIPYELQCSCYQGRHQAVSPLEFLVSK